jgi:hypothetical protein
MFNKRKRLVKGLDGSFSKSRGREVDSGCVSVAQ